MLWLGLGLDTESGYAALVDGEAVVRRFHLDREDREPLKAAVAEVGGRVAVALDLDLLHRRFAYPFRQRRKILRALGMALEEALPQPPEHYRRREAIRPAEGGALVDVTLVAEPRLEELLDTWLPEGVVPRFAAPAVLWAAEALAVAEGVIVWLGARRTQVAVYLDGRWAYAFGVPIGRTHLGEARARATLATRLAAGVGEEAATLPWIVAGVAPGDTEVAAFCERVAPGRWRFAEVQADTEELDGAAIAAARLAAARRRPPWNLAPAQPGLLAEAWRSARWRPWLAPGAAAALGLVVAHVAGTTALEAETEAYRREVVQVFQRNFPDSRIIDPVRQARAIVARAGGGATARPAAAGPVLGRMRDLFAAVTAPVVVTDLRVAAGDWQLEGEAEDYGTVDQVKEAVAGLAWAEEVVVKRAEKAVGREVIRFKLVWREREGA